MSEIGVSATAHGKELLALGYTVDQVVHDYGDLCQAITDLAFERDAPFTIDEYRTLNRCLDNAIADAVSSFSKRQDESAALKQSAAVNERLGFMAHELRNSLQTATLALNAMQTGNLPVSGATGAVLRRSLTALTMLIDAAVSEVRLAHPDNQREVFSVATFIKDVAESAALEANTRGCTFTVAEVDPTLGVAAKRNLLVAAVMNLLQNAFKFTHSRTEVVLNAYPVGERVHIDVKDHCGGLPADSAVTMFSPFAQAGSDKSGLGLGLSVARQNVEADGGTLSVRDMPGTGCVLTISLPLHPLQAV